MRIVRVDDIRFQIPDDAEEPPAGMKVEFGARCKLQQVVSFRSATCELSVRMSHENSAMSALSKAENGQEDLTLAAPPRTLGVDVQGYHHSSLRFCSSQSFANFRKT